MERAMTPETKQLFEQANIARSDFKQGRITREQCTRLIAPYAELYNAKAKEIGKEFGMRPKLFSMTSYLR